MRDRRPGKLVVPLIVVIAMIDGQYHLAATRSIDEARGWFGDLVGLPVIERAECHSHKGMAATRCADGIMSSVRFRHGVLVPYPYSTGPLSEW